MTNRVAVVTVTVAETVPPEPIRDLRLLTRLRVSLTAECSRHKQCVEKILKDSLVKVSAVVSDLFGKSGRAMLAALVTGKRDPQVLSVAMKKSPCVARYRSPVVAGLALGRLRPRQAQLAEALTGRFREVHAYEIGLLLHLIDSLEATIAGLDAKIETHLAALPGVLPACTCCGLIGGHAPRLRQRRRPQGVAPAHPALNQLSLRQASGRPPRAAACQVTVGYFR